MERIRRSKMCLYLRKRKSNQRYDIKKTDVDKKVESIITCSNHHDVCHSYHDRINFVDALQDVLLTALRLLEHVKWDCFDLYCMTDPVQIQKFLLDKFSDSQEILSVFVEKIHGADKDKVWCSDIERQNKVNSIMDGKLRGGIPVRGNYVDHAVSLVRTAKMYIANCRNEKDKKVHLKKLRLFEALDELREIRNVYGILPDDPTNDENWFLDTIH